MTGPEVIALDGVRKTFGPVVAVNDARFAIHRGEFFSLLGPSGCGKTTILKMIAGFERPTSGRVLLDGVDVSDVPPWKRHVNTVFQQYALFPHLSVADNVAFGPRSTGMPAGEIARRVGDALEMVRLGGLGSRRPAQLSGGQQQRVALARALVNLPSALLLDEPMAALDLKLREAMQLELKRIQRDVGITFLLVTHDQGEALTMSDRIAVMNNGVIEQVGTPEEIYQRPASLFVAAFIGSANLLPGTAVVSDGASTIVELRAGVRMRAVNAGLPLPAGDPCTVMLRPERLPPSIDAPADGQGLPATIAQVVYQGATTRLQLHLADGTTVVSHVGSHAWLPFVRAGQSLWLTWEPAAPYVLRGWPDRAGAASIDVDQVEASL